MSLNKTPNSSRINIGIYGKRNAGKSSLLNAITAQETSLVSEIKGTTADPVKKAMEFIPLGPVLFIDTAGLDDSGKLGEKRVNRSLKTLERCDFALYVMDINEMDMNSFKNTERQFKRFNIPYLVVVNKIDTVSNKKINKIKNNHPDYSFVSATENINILDLKDIIIDKIEDDAQEPPIIGDLVPYNAKVIMVVPIDSEAPKGRIILPQVQSIRDCLDHGIKSYVVRDTELTSALNDIKNVDLVITDSQAFKKVGEIVPDNINLTSFSILFARYKGDLQEFIDGLQTMEKLNKNDNILISETCTHNVSCEDIGRVKIPHLIRKNIDPDINFKVMGGGDFPNNPDNYDLIIHCGACMLNRKAMQSRLMFCRENDIPITNYGMTLAYFHGILERALKIFDHYTK